MHPFLLDKQITNHFKIIIMRRIYRISNKKNALYFKKIFSTLFIRVFLFILALTFSMQLRAQLSFTNLATDVWSNASNWETPNTNNGIISTSSNTFNTTQSGIVANEFIYNISGSLVGTVQSVSAISPYTITLTANALLGITAGTKIRVRGVPTSADAVTIFGNTTVTIDISAFCNSLTFPANNPGLSTLTISGTNSFQVASSITIGRPGNNANNPNTINVGQGTIICGSIALGGTTGTRTTIINLSTGSVTVTGDITSAGVSSQIIFSDAGTINIGGAFMSVTAGTFTASTSTVNYNSSGNQSIAPFAYTFNNVTLTGSGGTNIKTLTNATINGILSIEGTATASGTVTSYGSNATIQYKGSQAQTTGSELPSSFSGAGGTIINNSAGVTLNSSLTLSSQLTLTNGILTTSSNTLALGSAATISGGSSTSYVNGAIDYTMVNGGNYFFPVGAGTYYPVRLLNVVCSGSPVVRVTPASSGTGTADGTTILSPLSTYNWEISLTSGTFTSCDIQLENSDVANTKDIGGSATQGGTYSSLNGIYSSTSVHGSAGAAIYTNTQAITTLPAYFALGTSEIKFYSRGGDASSLSNWNSLRDGTGSSPTDFISANQIFIVQNGFDMSVGAPWSVSGSNTKIEIENSATLTANYPVSASAATTFQIFNGGTYNQNHNTNNNIFNGINSFGATSTVNYMLNNVQTIAGINYTGNLTLSGSGIKTLQSSTTSVGGSLTLNGTVSTTTVAGMAISQNFTVGDGCSFTSAGFDLTISGTTTVGNGSTGNLIINSSTGARIFTGLVTVNSGATWNNSGNAAITFRGSITNSGTFTSGSGIQTFDTNAQTLSGIFNIQNLTVTGITLTNNGTLTVTSSLTGTGGFTNGATGTLNINFTGTPAITTLTATASGNTVNYGFAGTQTVFSTNYYHLTLSNSGVKTLQTGTTTIGGNLTLSGTVSTTTVFTTTIITGNLNIGDGTTFNVATGLTVTGTTNVGNGASGHLSITTKTGTKTFVGLVTIYNGGTWDNPIGEAVTIEGGITNNGTFSSGVGVHTFKTNNQALIGTLSISSITVTGVTLTNNGPLTVGTALTGTGGLTNSAIGTLYIGGTSTITTLTATAVGNTVNYDGAAQTLIVTTYHHLDLSGSGIKTMGAITNINGNLSMSGTATATSGANLSIGGNLSIGDGTTFTVGAFTLSVGGTATVGGGASGTIIFSSAANPAMTFTGLVTINSGASWTENAAVTPTFSNGITNAGTFTDGSGVHTFANNSQPLTGIFSIGNVTITGVTLTNNGTLTVGTNLTGTGTLQQTNGSTLNIGGTSTIATLTANIASNTVNYNGAGQNIFTTIYDKLILSGSGTKTFGAALTIIEDFTINTSVIANLGTYTSSSNTLFFGGTGQTAGHWGGTGTSGTLINTTYFAANSGEIDVATTPSGLWTGTTNTDWNTSTNWNTNSVPDATTVVSIPVVTNLPVISSTAFCKDITIQASASLTISGSNTLTVSGNWTNNNTFTPGTGTVIFNGAAQTINGTNTFNNLTLSGSGVKTLSSGTVNGILSMEGTASVSATPTFGSAATLQYKGSAQQTTGVEFPSTFSGTGGVIINNTNGVKFVGAKTISKSLNITAGTFDLNGNIQTVGDLQGSGIITNNGSAATLITGSDNASTTYSGSIQDGTGTVALTISTTGVFTLNGNSTYSVATKLNNGGTLNINSSTAIGTSPFTISAASKIDNTSGNPISINNVVTWTSGFTFLGSNKLTFGTASINAPVGGSRTLTINNNELVIAENISGGLTLTKAGSGTLTLSGANIFTGGVTLSAGTLNINSSTALGTGAFTITTGTIDNTSGASITLSNNNAQNWNGDFTFKGTNNLNLGTGAVTLSATRQVTVTANTLTVGGTLSASSFNLTKTGSGTLAFGNNDVTINNLSINAGSFTAPTTNLNLSGNFTNNGTFAHSNCTIAFNGSSTQTVSGSSSIVFNNLTVANNVNLSNDVTINGNLQIQVGKVLNSGSSNITINGNWTDNNTSTQGFVPGTGNVTFNGTSTQTIATSYDAAHGENFNDVVISGTDVQLNASGTTLIGGNFTINTGGKFTILPTIQLTVSGTTTNNGTFNLNANSSGLASFIDHNSSIPGTTNVQVFLPVTKFHYIASPIKYAYASMFIESNRLLIYWSEPTYTWQWMNPGGLMSVGLGYSAKFINSDKTITYNGQLNTGSFSHALTYTTASKSPGWNLIGNPYPSAIDWESPSITKTNIYNAIYLWNGINYSCYLSSGGDSTGVHAGAVNGATRYIPAQQAFFVKVKNASGGTYSGDNPARVHSSQTFYKKEELVDNNLRFTASGNGYDDEMLIRLLPQSTMQFDDDLDAYKFFTSTTTVPQIYSIVDNTSVAINSVPLSDQPFEIPIGFYAGASGNYSLQITENTINTGYQMFLDDLKAGNTMDISNFTTYNFDYLTSDAPNRFLLHFMGIPTSINPVDTKKSVQIYTTGQSVYVQLQGDETNVKFQVYDLLGREICFQNATAGLNKIAISRTGYYLVKVQTSKNIYTQKVFIQ